MSDVTPEGHIVHKDVVQWITDCLREERQVNHDGKSARCFLDHREYWVKFVCGLIIMLAILYSCKG